MLSHDERRRLDVLGDNLCRQDPRFATAFRLGRPCQPYEYRRQRKAILILTAAAGLVPALFGYWLLGILTAWITFAISFLVGREDLDRPPRRCGGCR